MIPRVVPPLGLWQRLQLWVCGSAFVCWERPEGYSGYVPLYVVKCRRHGLFVDFPHGFDGHFHCPDCLAERFGVVEVAVK